MLRHVLPYSPPPPSLMQLMEANCRPQTKHWTSSNTWPSKEWLVVEEEIAFIILMLSPSMTNSEKPASMENSRAFLQAKAFASSLLFTLRPFHRHCCHYLTSLIANYCTKARAFQVRKNGSIKIQFINWWRGEVTKNPCLVLWLGLTDGQGRRERAAKEGICPPDAPKILK